MVGRVTLRARRRDLTQSSAHGVTRLTAPDAKPSQIDFGNDLIALPRDRRTDLGRLRPYQ